MKRTKLLGVLTAAALSLVLAACVYDDGPSAGGHTAVPPIAQITDGVITADAATRTATVSTSYTYTNLATRSGASYEEARAAGNTNVVMQFTFNADGSLASYNIVSTGHGADGAAMCNRWDDSNENNVTPWLGRLIADGTVLPADVDTATRATYSKTAVLRTLNEAAAQFTFEAAAPGAGDAAAGRFIPGTHQGTSNNTYSHRPDNEGGLTPTPLVVEITVDDNNITAITIVSHGESGPWAGPMTQGVRDAIVANNGTEGVNAAPGATFTSYAIIEAANYAIAAATR